MQGISLSLMQFALRIPFLNVFVVAHLLKSLIIELNLDQIELRKQKYHREFVLPYMREKISEQIRLLNHQRLRLARHLLQSELISNEALDDIEYWLLFSNQIVDQFIKIGFVDPSGLPVYNMQMAEFDEDTNTWTFIENNITHMPWESDPTLQQRFSQTHRDALANIVKTEAKLTRLSKKLALLGGLVVVN